MRGSKRLKEENEAWRNSAQKHLSTISKGIMKNSRKISRNSKGNLQNSRGKLDDQIEQI